MVASTPRSARILQPDGPTSTIPRLMALVQSAETTLWTILLCSGWSPGHTARGGGLKAAATLESTRKRRPAKKPFWRLHGAHGLMRRVFELLFPPNQCWPPGPLATTRSLRDERAAASPPYLEMLLRTDSRNRSFALSGNAACQGTPGEASTQDLPS